MANKVNVGIIGCGLIGGSFARAFKDKGHNVYVFDRDESITKYAELAGASNGVLDDKTLPCCDLVLIALYPSDAVAFMEENAIKFSKNTLVIDCCGTKRLVCEEGFRLAKEHGFVYAGGHPMAGTQYSGFKHSKADLFKGAPMVIVLPEHAEIELLQRIKDSLAPAEFGHISFTSAEQHDKTIAFTSQLAHVVSNAYIKSPTARQHKGVSAGSYKDLTRVAWLNEEMWTDLFLENAENLEYEITTLIENLEQYRKAIHNRDAVCLKELLAQGRKIKEEVDGA